MINIELQENDSLHQKIHKLKSYRLALKILSDIEYFINGYYSGVNNFKFNTFKSNVTLILEKYDIDFQFEYEYDKTYDLIKIIIDGNFILNVKFISESEYHI